MWSSEPLRRGLLVLLLATSVASLPGCTMTPVYGDRGLDASSMALSYASPQTRLEQVIYQELALSFGADAGPTAPTIRVSTVSSARDLTRTGSPDPQPLKEVTVTAVATITSPSGQVLPTITRSATASYRGGPQVLANTIAFDEAAERAAKSVAEALRLAIFSTLNR
jgi:LPS-assembly lipoprotein